MFDAKACKISVKCLPRWITTRKNYANKINKCCVCVCAHTRTRLELWRKKKAQPANKQIAYLEQILFYFWNYVFGLSIVYIKICTHAAHIKYMHGLAAVVIWKCLISVPMMHQKTLFPSNKSHTHVYRYVEFGFEFGFEMFLMILHSIGWSTGSQRIMHFDALRIINA